jgi:hypothetical protein
MAKRKEACSGAIETGRLYEDRAGIEIRKIDGRTGNGGTREIWEIEGIIRRVTMIVTAKETYIDQEITGTGVAAESDTDIGTPIVKNQTENITVMTVTIEKD